MGSDPRSARALLRRSSTVVAAQAVLLLITVALAALVGWEAAVVGLALMQLVTTVVVVGPWGAAPRATAGGAASTDVAELTQRVDALGARLVASTERTRVEVLDALADGRRDRTP